jgi:cell division protein FtsZ
MINLDFADVKTVMKGMGVALMGIGHAKGDNAAVKAMKAAIDSKLLEENSIKGAKGALINITGSKDMPLNEVEDALALIHDEAHEDASIIFGTVFDENMEDEVKITVIATGFDNQSQIALPSAPMTDTQAVGGQFGARAALKPIEKPREEDINVPTFIRRQAD